MKLGICTLIFIGILGCVSALSFSKPITAQFVVDHLDVTSFASSLGPRRQDGLLHFKDYGFLPKKVTEKTVELEEKEGGWRFNVKILDHRGEKLLICLEDQAKNGGSYHSQIILSVVPTPEKGLLRAEKKKFTHPDCPEFVK